MVTSVQYLTDLPANLNGAFAIIGDTQRTLALEKYAMGREVNFKETQNIVSCMFSEKPAFAVHVGDLVGIGASQRHWNFFDAVFAKFRETQTPLLPAVGNHDYWGPNFLAVPKLAERFPQIRQKRWYVRVYQGLALVILDTNQVNLRLKLWLEQKDWFDQTIQQLEGDDSVRGILVFAHHPPFTNSESNKDAWWVRRAFVESFKSANKTLGFFSGHAHGYERFLIDGKTFVVTGGGGGPRVKLCEDELKRHTDLFKAPSPRPFNYVMCEPGAQGARFTVKGFDKGDRQTRVLEEFYLKYP